MTYGTTITFHISVYDNPLDNKAGMRCLMSKALATILLADSLYMEMMHAEGLASEAHLRCSR